VRVRVGEDETFVVNISRECGEGEGEGEGGQGVSDGARTRRRRRHWVEAEAEARRRRRCWGQLRVRWRRAGDKNKTRDGTTRTIACIVSFLFVVRVIIGRIVVVVVSS
jgi:hypothetical protein